ncbi:MAG: hypothetical protein ACKOFN_09765, partial [Vulcanococcus sp.]
MDVPVGQEMARKHREGSPAPDTEVALNRHQSFAGHRTIALVTTMAMDGAGAPVRATRAIAYKLAFTKLDDLSKAGFAVDINLSLRPGPRLLLHGSIRHHSTFYPRFHAKRYSKRELLERTRWMWLKNRANWTEKETHKWESMALERCVTGMAYEMRLVLQGIYQWKDV